MDQYITRIAPSPTGEFHLGTARTAYFNWLAARASGGRFILRIDDTDVDRNNTEAVYTIIHSLQWLGLDWDQLVHQSDRLDLYRKYAETFVRCGCAVQLENGAIALKLPEMPASFEDTIAGTIAITETNHKQIDGMILMRGGDKLGQPTYQFCSIIDDIEMGVNWIIRGVDHITNTPKQLAIWLAFYGEDSTVRVPPRFSHVGLIHKDGKKMSKRDDAASLLWYRDRGYHPDAILSFILRMGWGPRNEDKSHKIITRERALELFLEGGAMRASPANYDQARLDLTQANYEKMLNIPHDQWVRNRGQAALADRNHPPE